MTPATQKPIFSGFVIQPVDPEVVHGDRGDEITWEKVNPGGGQFPLDHLLDDFCRLAYAQPEEMAAFVARYAVPEVDGFEVNDSWVRSMRSGRVSIRAIRDAARAVAAARRIGAGLVSRQPGDSRDWLDLQTGFGVGFVHHQDPEDQTDWKIQREDFAQYLSAAFEKWGVSMQVDWLGSRGLAFVPHTESFMGGLLVMLAREVGAEGQYRCDVCGTRVPRRRAPAPGEHVYCDRLECKREQQRRNQAAWRERKRQEEANHGKH